MNRLVPISLFFSVIVLGVVLNFWGKYPARKPASPMIRISPGLSAPTMAREAPAPPQLWIPDNSKSVKPPAAEFKKHIEIAAEEARRAPAASVPAAPGNSPLLPLPSPGPVITWDAAKAEADYKHEMDTRAFYVKVVFSAVALLAALVIIFGKSHFPEDSMKWAYGIAGTLAGYWLR